MNLNINQKIQNFGDIAETEKASRKAEQISMAAGTSYGSAVRNIQAIEPKTQSLDKELSNEKLAEEISAAREKQLKLEPKFGENIAFVELKNSQTKNNQDDCPWCSSNGAEVV